MESKRVTALDIMEAASRIYFEATDGKSNREIDPAVVRQGVHAWLSGALIYLENQVPSNLLGPGLFLMTELEGLDRGKKGRLFDKRFENPCDLEALSTLGVDISDLPPQDVERAGAPGKSISETVRDGMACAVIDALVADGWKPREAADYVADTLGLDRNKLIRLKKRLSAARGKGKAYRDRETFRIYLDTLERLLSHQKPRKAHAMKVLRPLIALRGLPPHK